MSEDKQQFFERLGYHPHPGQALFHDSPARFRILACGRRWGKSQAAAAEALYAAQTPGQRIWVVAPTYQLTKRIWREVYGNVLRRLKDQAAAISRSELCIEWKNGSLLHCRSADNPLLLVGEGIHLLILEEAARVAEIAYIESLRPTLTDTLGRLVALSTPRGRNWFHRLFLKGRSGDPDWISWQSPTADNPHIAPSELVAARSELPDRSFRQEYGAEFVSDEGSVFPEADACIGGELLERPRPGFTYWLGADWGKAVDYTALVVLEAETGQVVAFDRLKGLPWHLQIERTVALACRFGTRRLVCDRTGLGDVLLETLQRAARQLPFPCRVEGFRFDTVSKQELLDHLAVLIEGRSIAYPPLPPLLEELRAFEYTRTPSGHLGMSAPPGQHDDCVIALALACWNLRTREPALEWLSAGRRESLEE
ncbi:MAG: hypothetical protein IT210_18340 [Armatimonadetes bacterium]|nr:hypothetical protein [Armatimonadota bacterium]